MVPEPPVKRTAAVLTDFPVFSRVFISTNSPAMDLFRACNSWSSSFIRFSRFWSPSPISQLMMSRISGGSLLSITDHKRLPYVSGVTPMALSPRTCASMVLYNRRRAFRCVSDETASTLSSTSICLFMMGCLFPKRWCSTSTASR